MHSHSKLWVIFLTGENQPMGKRVYTRVDNRQVSVPLSKNHPTLVFKINFRLPYRGGSWACFSSPFGTFFLRGHPAWCNKNLICSHECIETFKAFDQLFSPTLFPRSFLILSSLSHIGWQELQVRIICWKIQTYYSKLSSNST
jgi:hypothetical protein